jgi:hypothetical protein
MSDDKLRQYYHGETGYFDGIEMAGDAESKPTPILSPKQVREIEEATWHRTAFMECRAKVQALCDAYARLHKAVRALPVEAFSSAEERCIQLARASNVDAEHRPEWLKDAATWKRLAAIRAEMEDGRADVTRVTESLTDSAPDTEHCTELARGD